MQRIILILIFLVIATIGSGLGYLYSKNPTRIYPLPYQVANQTYGTDNIAEDADILIVGDDFGVEFNNQVQKLVETLSEKLKKPLSIYNLAQNGEGIHRTLNKLKKLKRLPPIIVYMSGGSEFHEDLYPQDIRKFKVNFKIYKNDYAQTFIMLMPVLSRFLFFPDQVKSLGQEIIKSKKRNDRNFQVIAESTFYFFKEQLMDLVDYISENKSTVIMVTPVVNYERKVQKVCDNAVTDDITIEQVDINKLLENNRLKEAYNKTLILDGISVGNAQTKYLLAKSQLAQGKFKLAKKNFILAKALDCAPSEAHPVVNQIIRQVIKQRSLENIDFDNIVNNDLGKEVLFLNDNSPQFIYWEKLETELTLKIKRILDL